MRLFDDVASRVDDPYLAHAVALAVRARGATWPNPLVGCVVVRDGRIVGEGLHPRAGEPHAEVFALADAGELARGADLFVTLEPCAHVGRTPPCTEAILDAGVARVVIGMRDPGAESGGGAEILRSAGVAVEFAQDPAPFAALNEGWLKRLATGLPFLTVKVALSLDARPALHAGARAVITGDAGAEITRRVRAQADAVLVGSATVTADDPALTVRDASGRAAERQPLRVVLVRDSLPDVDSRLFTDACAPTLVLAADRTSPGSLDALPGSVEALLYPSGEGIRGALRVLGERGLNDILVEAGPRLFTSLWEDGLVDALVTVTAGGMGGASAPPLFGGTADCAGDTLVHVFRPVETGIVGDVTATLWRPSDAG